MIRYILIAVMGITSLQAQRENNCSPRYKVAPGELMEIAKPSAHVYEYIDLPRPNFLIKRGGIANFNKLQGQKVKVTDVKTTEDCKTEIRVRREDGKRFFNALETLSIDLDEAVEAGEIKFINSINS